MMMAVVHHHAKVAPEVSGMMTHQSASAACEVWQPFWVEQSAAALAVCVV